MRLNMDIILSSVFRFFYHWNFSKQTKHQSKYKIPSNAKKQTKCFQVVAKVYMVLD